jgi:hypothetical protein
MLVMAATGFFGLAAASGCEQSFVTEGDELRARVLDLENENRQLARRVEELETELQMAAARPESLPEAVRAAQPHVADIALGRLSHVVDLDEDGRPDRVRLYVEPRDGRGRFVQLVGTLSVNAALMPAEAAAETVGRLTLGPLELRDAYRSGITGTHYTIEVPVTLPPAAAEREILVRVVYVDGRTGAEHTAQRAVPL